MSTIQRKSVAYTAIGATIAGVAAFGGHAAMSQAATTHPGTVHTKSANLTVRSGPSSSAAAVGSLRKGSKVAISCQIQGTRVNGTYGSSTWWDKIGTGRYVSDAYVLTGSDGRVAPLCKSPGGGGGTQTSGSAKAVIAAAKSQMGKGYLYSWGGGGKSGPSYGSTSPSGYNDAKRYGYDCSGLTEFAFWQGAHKSIGGYSGAQVGSGKHYPFSQRKAGDLVFWGGGLGSTTHVAIYLGNNKIIEAAPPRDKNSIRITSVYSPGSPLQTVVRPTA
ncbi:C40 family peptidase [Calidifontibacter terrae]